MDTPIQGKAGKDEADMVRRNFLKSCGKFAVVTPPAVALLLSTSLDSPAVAASGGASNGSGGGGGGSGTSCDFLCSIFKNF